MQQQTYNDGKIQIFAVENVAVAGDRPKEGLRPRASLRFARRTLGVQRYNKALANHIRLALVLRCPYREAINTNDVAIVEGKQYAVMRIQRPEDVVPPSMDLELSRLEQDYAR